MKLNEIFDSKIENFQWQKSGNYKLGQFEIDNVPYIIQIEDRQIIEVPATKDLKTAEISYFRHDKSGDKSFSTTSDVGSNIFALYGVIKNAVVPEFKNYDAFYFDAKRKHSNNEKEYQQKIKLNKALLRKIDVETQEETFRYESQGSNSYEFLISKVEIHDDRLKEPLREALESCNFPSQKFYTNTYKERQENEVK